MQMKLFFLVFIIDVPQDYYCISFTQSETCRRITGKGITFFWPCPRTTRFVFSSFWIKGKNINSRCNFLFSGFNYFKCTSEGYILNHIKRAAQCTEAPAYAGSGIYIKNNQTKIRQSYHLLALTLNY